MRTYFEPVLQLDVFHSYYIDNRCKALDFIPTDSCIDLLNRFRLLYKNTESGFIVVGEKNNIGTEAVPVLVPKIDIPEGTKFYFFIVHRRSDFLNITNADMNKLSEGKKYYFRNPLASPVINSGKAVFSVHNNTPISNSLLLSSVNFLAPIVIAENPVRLILLDADGVLIVEKVVPRTNTNVIIPNRLLMSTLTLDEGFYTLRQVNGAGVVTSSQDYFLTSRSIEGDVGGILVLDYHAFVALHDDKEVRMEMNLSNRSIRWVYRIEIENYTDPSEAGFTYNANTIQIDTANTAPPLGSLFTKTITAPPTPAENFKVKFRSNNTIPLREKSYEEVTLKSNAAILIDHLPNPNPLMMRSNAGNYESEIYLKIK